jgi:transposase-like protein
MSDKNASAMAQAHSALAQLLKHTIEAAVEGALEQIIEQEVCARCGPAYKPTAGSPCRRAGSSPSHVYLQGRKLALKRPRVREHRADGSSREVGLEGWQAAQDPQCWQEAIMRATLCGVSTRDHQLLHPEAGVSKSEASRLWVERSAQLVHQLQGSDLKDFDLVVLIIDGVVLAKDLVVTVAMGIDGAAQKRILSWRVGPSENEQVCLDLLLSLQQRGLRVPDARVLLALLDGSAALRAAVLRCFPQALVQRCLVHKERNLRGYLSQRHWQQLAGLMNTLRKSASHKAAQQALGRLRDFVRQRPEAANCLEQGAQDLLTLFSLEVPVQLHRSLLSTNSIENVFKNLRRHLGRVCRWREDTAQADRWMASGLSLVQRGLRRLAGHQHMSALIQALEKVAQERARASA